MAGYGVMPSIRVRDVPRALEFYRKLGFELQRGNEADDNLSLRRGDANIMIEKAADFYSPGYNEAIRARIGTASANAFYMEAEDLEALYARVGEASLKVIDPLSDREWGQAEFTVEDPEGTWLTFWKVAGSS